MKPFPSSESFKGSHCLLELSSNSRLFHPFVILLMLFPLPGMPFLTICLTTLPHLLGLSSGISSSWHFSWHLALRQNWPQPPLYQSLPTPPYYNNITYHIVRKFSISLSDSLPGFKAPCLWILNQGVDPGLPWWSSVWESACHRRGQFWSLVWEDSTCCLATKAMCHNYWSLCPRACIPQEKPLQREAHAPRLESGPRSLHQKKPSRRNKDLVQPK